MKGTKLWVRADPAGSILVRVKSKRYWVTVPRSKVEISAAVAENASAPPPSRSPERTGTVAPSATNTKYPAVMVSPVSVPGRNVGVARSVRWPSADISAAASASLEPRLRPRSVCAWRATPARG
jgi:hypothetical protein